MMAGPVIRDEGRPAESAPPAGGRVMPAGTVSSFVSCECLQTIAYSRDAGKGNVARGLVPRFQRNANHQ